MDEKDLVKRLEELRNDLQRMHDFPPDSVWDRICVHMSYKDIVFGVVAELDRTLSDIKKVS